MNHSEQLGELAAALAKAQGEMEGAKKDAANPFFKSKYADLASVWDACRAALSKNGLAVVQVPSAEGAAVSVETLLIHASGQWIKGVLTVEAKDASAQSVGSAITYLRRYALQGVTGVAPEDDDGNEAGKPPADAPRATNAPSRPSAPRPTAVPAQASLDASKAPCPKCGVTCGPSTYPKQGATHYCRACKASFDPDAKPFEASDADVEFLR